MFSFSNCFLQNIIFQLRPRETRFEYQILLSNQLTILQLDFNYKILCTVSQWELWITSGHHQCHQCHHFRPGHLFHTCRIRAFPPPKKSLLLLIVGKGIECWWKVINWKATSARLKCQELKGGSIAVIIDLQTFKQIKEGVDEMHPPNLFLKKLNWNHRHWKKFEWNAACPKLKCKYGYFINATNVSTL